MHFFPDWTIANTYSSAMLETPINTVVPRGGQLRSYCMSSNPRDRIVFRHYRGSATVAIFDNGTTSQMDSQMSGQSGHARHDVTYERSVTISSQRRAVLQISFADFDDSGTYSCQSEHNRTIYYFEVIVIGR